MAIVLLLSVSTLAFVYWLLIGHYAFVLEFENGNLRMVKGNLPDSFLNQCQQSVCLGKGLVKGRYHGGQITLYFSDSLSEGERQLFRNKFPYAAFGHRPLSWHSPF